MKPHFAENKQQNRCLQVSQWFCRTSAPRTGSMRKLARHNKCGVAQPLFLNASSTEVDERASAIDKKAGNEQNNSNDDDDDEYEQAHQFYFVYVPS